MCWWSGSSGRVFGVTGDALFVGRPGFGDGVQGSGMKV